MSKVKTVETIKKRIQISRGGFKVEEKLNIQNENTVNWTVARGNWTVAGRNWKVAQGNWAVGPEIWTVAQGNWTDPTLTNPTTYS